MRNSSLRAKKGFFTEAVLLVLLIAAVSIINLSWIIKDTRPLAFRDPYPQKILEFSDGFSKSGLNHFSWLINRLCVGLRPPLYQLLAVPCVYAFGRTEDAMLVVNILSGVVLMLAAYGSGKLARNGATGLLAALIVATYPPLVNLVKIARPHSILPAFVALTLWLLLLLIRTRSTRIFWLLGASLGVGFLVHPNFAYFMPFPAVIWGLYLVFFQIYPKYPRGFRDLPRWILLKLRDPLIVRGLVPAIILAAGLPALWYLPRISATLNLLHHSAESWSNVTMGFPDLPSSFWWYALTMPGAISSVFTLLLAVSLLVVILRPRIYSTVVGITFILAYVGISMREGTWGWMNAASILPLAAVLTAVGLTEFYNIFRFSPPASLPESSSIKFFPRPVVLIRRLGRVFSLVMLLVCIIVAVFNFSVVTWGIPPHCEGILRALGAPLCSSCGWRMIVAFCPNPPRKEDWRMSDVLRVIVKDSEGEKAKNSLAVVSINKDNFRYSVLCYYHVRDFPEFKLEIELINRQRHPTLKLNWLSSKYVVYIPRSKITPYSRAIEIFLENPPQIFKDAHKEIGAFQLHDGMTAYLIKRTKDLTLEEAEISIAALKYLKKDTKKQLLNEARTLLGTNQHSNSRSH